MDKIMLVVTVGLVIDEYKNNYNKYCDTYCTGLGISVDFLPIYALIG